MERLTPAWLLLCVIVVIVGWLALAVTSDRLRHGNASAHVEGLE